MKYWIGILLAVLMLLSPFRGNDVGKLRPVELVAMRREENTVVLETDTGDIGRGEDPLKALEDMKGSAPGALFLDTADYFLVTRETENLLPELAEVLRPAVEICVLRDPVDLEEAAEYLRAHSPKVTLLQWRTQGKAMPELRSEGGKCQIVNNR